MARQSRARRRQAQWRRWLARVVHAQVRGGHTVACERTTWSRGTARDR
jgi:hypothetical protein